MRLSAETWLAVAGWPGWVSLPFAALGLIIGYLAKPDSVQQVSALLYLLLAAFGGIWVPVEQMPTSCTASPSGHRRTGSASAPAGRCSTALRHHGRLMVLAGLDRWCSG